MRYTSPPDQPLPAAVHQIFLIWSLGVLGAYLVVRTGDLQPMLWSVAMRGLDIGVPLALLAAYLPAGNALSRECLGLSERAGDRLLFALASSVGLLISATTLLGCLGLLTPICLLGMAMVVAVCFWRDAPAVARDIRAVIPDVGRAVRSVPGCVLSIILGLALVMTLTPAVSQDALHYHLSVPRHWLASGGFVDLPGNVYGRFPMNVELLFLNGIGLRGEIAAKAFHWILAVLSTLAVRRLAVKFASPSGALWAALIFLSVPTVFRVSTWAYVEMGMVLFLVVAWIALLERRPHGAGSGLWIGFMLGLACGTKYTMLLPALVIAFVTVLRSECRFSTGLAGFAGGLIGGGFWYLRNLLDRGNPVFPFFYSAFGGAGWDSDRNEAFVSSLRSWGEPGWDLPLSVTYRAVFSSVEGFDGMPGPVFLVGLPLVALAVWRRPPLRSTGALAVLLGAQWAFTTLQVRFLVPTLAFLAVLIPVGWETFAPRSRRWVQSMVAVGVALALTAPLILYGRQAPTAFALGMESGDELRARTLPGGDYELFRVLPELVPSSGRILFAASGNPVFLCARPFHADSVVENHTLRQLIRDGRDPAGFAQRFRARGFTHLLFRFPLVFGTGSDLTPVEQQILGEALNRFGRLQFQADETLLYRIVEPERRGRP